jgi:predicted nucleic acid-binding protein
LTVYVVDASVASRWFVADPLSARCRRVLGETAIERIAPTLVIYELANIAWKLTRVGRLDAGQLDEMLRRAPQHFDRLVEPTSSAPRAGELAVTLGRAAYDCFYLALAERERATLVTADNGLYLAAIRIGVVAERIAADA